MTVSTHEKHIITRSTLLPDHREVRKFNPQEESGRMHLQMVVDRVV